MITNYSNIFSVVMALLLFIIILVVAHQRILDKGVAFIQKPFSMADMTEKVREVLDMALDKNQG